MGDPTTSYEVRLSFERAELPPFDDILVLGRRSPIGMAGISKCLEYLVPNHYEVLGLEDDVAEAMVVHRSITKRMPTARIVALLKERVIPFMCDTEMIRVDLTIRVSCEDLHVPG